MLESGGSININLGTFENWDPAVGVVKQATMILRYGQFEYWDTLTASEYSSMQIQLSTDVTRARWAARGPMASQPRLSDWQYYEAPIASGDRDTNFALTIPQPLPASQYPGSGGGGPVTLGPITAIPVAFGPKTGIGRPLR